MSTVFFGNLKIFRFFGFSGFEFRGFGFGFRGFGFGFRGSGFGFRGFGVWIQVSGFGIDRFHCEVYFGNSRQSLLRDMQALAARYETLLYAVRNTDVCGTEHGCLRYGTRLFAVRNMAARGTEHGCSRYGTRLLAVWNMAAALYGKAAALYGKAAALYGKRLLARCMGSGRLDIAARKEYNWPARSGVRCT